MHINVTNHSSVAYGIWRRRFLNFKGFLMYSYVKFTHPLQPHPCPRGYDLNKLESTPPMLKFTDGTDWQKNTDGRKWAKKISLWNIGFDIFWCKDERSNFTDKLWIIHILWEWKLKEKNVFQSVEKERRFKNRSLLASFSKFHCQ